MQLLSPQQSAASRNNNLIIKLIVMVDRRFYAITTAVNLCHLFKWSGTQIGAKGTGRKARLSATVMSSVSKKGVAITIN